LKETIVAGGCEPLAKPEIRVTFRLHPIAGLNWIGMPSWAASPISRRDWKPDAFLLGLAISCVPVSVAISESLLAGALLFRFIALARGRGQLYFPRILWVWLAWAAWELVAWLHSPDLRAGQGEIRHLILLALMFLVMPSLDRSTHRIAVWRGVIAAATLSSLFLIGRFFFRLFFHGAETNPVIYLRGGGLLHHWMVYGTVEVVVFAALLELLHYSPEERWWLGPALLVNAVAIFLSLTRMLWICSLLLLAIHLAWRRSRWTWAVPAIPGFLFVLAPGPVRSRIIDSSHPDYYSNAERVQMLKVGWRMVRASPIMGVGPGRVEALYTNYLTQGDPIPAYHGHLHNNLAQLAAEFGLPAAAAATLFVAVLLWNLWKQCRGAARREEQCLSRTSLLAAIGFLTGGLFDYTYGHSLGLILVAFAVLTALIPDLQTPTRNTQHQSGSANARIP
jgi:O-antigen ligase